MTSSPALCPRCGEMLEVYAPESGLQVGCPECLYLAPFDPIPEGDLASIDYVFEIDADVENPRRD